jgi:hypothetical protein
MIEPSTLTSPRRTARRTPSALTPATQAIGTRVRRPRSPSSRRITIPTGLFDVVLHLVEQAQTVPGR